MYKNEKETKLRHQIHMSDLTAVAFLKDPKHKRHNVFGLFSPSKNFHLQAPTAKDAQEWVELIRKDARIEEEEEEMFLASPRGQRQSPGLVTVSHAGQGEHMRDERLLSSSPEPSIAAPRRPGGSSARRRSSMFESSGLSGNELASHSDFSDNDVQRLHGASIESLAVQTPVESSSVPRAPRPGMVDRSLSQVSIANAEHADPDRVIWQGWLWLLRTKGGVRQWKDMWGVLRPRNFILYKDGSEYTAQWIVQLANVVDVVDVDPLSKSKNNCLQVITEEKSYRFCARDEEALVQCLGAFKSLLYKRRGLEARVVNTAA